MRMAVCLLVCVVPHAHKCPQGLKRALPLLELAPQDQNLGALQEQLCGADCCDCVTKATEPLFIRMAMECLSLVCPLLFLIFPKILAYAE